MKWPEAVVHRLVTRNRPIRARSSDGSNSSRCRSGECTTADVWRRSASHRGSTRCRTPRERHDGIHGPDHRRRCAGCYPTPPRRGRPAASATPTGACPPRRYSPRQHRGGDDPRCTVGGVGPAGRLVDLPADAAAHDQPGTAGARVARSVPVCTTHLLEQHHFRRDRRCAFAGCTRFRSYGAPRRASHAVAAGCSHGSRRAGLSRCQLGRCRRVPLRPHAVWLTSWRHRP